MSILDSLRNPPRVQTKQLNTCKGFEWCHDYFIVDANGNVATPAGVAPVHKPLGVEGNGSMYLTGSETSAGYYTVRISGPGMSKNSRVHRVVAAAWCEDWDPSLDVDHIDGNRKNNHPSNLRCVSRRENLLAGNTGTNFKGLGWHTPSVEICAYDVTNERYLRWPSVKATARWLKTQGKAGHGYPVSYRAQHNTNLMNGKRDENRSNMSFLQLHGLRFFRYNDLETQHKTHFENATLL